MTTEDDFQRALDADPTDWQTRLVFADWLQERGDVRADGYRALGRLKRCDCRDTHSGNGHFLWMRKTWRGSADYATLPADWLNNLEGGFQIFDDGEAVTENEESSGQWRDYRSRREADDAAARAFAKLPDARRIELLTIPPVRKTKPKAQARNRKKSKPKNQKK